MTDRQLIRSLAICAALSFCQGTFAPAVMGAEATRPDSAEAYVAIEPLNVSIIQKTRVRGLLQVEIGLDVQDPALRSRVLKLYPRLQDAYVRYLQFYTTNRLELNHTPHVIEIADTLQEATDQILGKKGATVLLSQVMLHRPG